MRVNITDSQQARIYNLIYDYIEDLMPELLAVTYYLHGYESDDEKKFDSVQVYGINETVFRIYKSNYWNPHKSSGRELAELSPIMEVNQEYEKELSSYFGNTWHEPFKQWVIDNFPELSDINIKTFHNKVI